MEYALFFSSHDFAAVNPAVSTIRATLPSWIIDEEDKDRYRNLAPRDFVIVFSQQARATLTSAEIEAIIAHEVGHLAEGHLSDENLAKGIQYQDSNEIQADAYAIAKCGARALYSGLRKVAKLSVAAAAQQDNLTSVQVIGALRAAARQIAPRIAAIRAAM